MVYVMSIAYITCLTKVIEMFYFVLLLSLNYVEPKMKIFIKMMKTHHLKRPLCPQQPKRKYKMRKTSSCCAVESLPEKPTSLWLAIVSWFEV